VRDSPGGLERSAPVELAREADFALGAAKVRPSLGEVVVGRLAIRLQPRVMQVLVALVRAEGEVVSRDELVASCWGGLAIGDDAIHRCIARLRRLAEEEAPGCFAIETFARIGYRLARLDASGAAAPAASRRRRIAPWRLGVGVLFALALAAGVWFALGRPGWPRPADGVAVIPFETPPGDALAHSFAGGVADEVASTLAKTDLKSLPADASAVASGAERDAAALRLGAAFTLGGRVQRDGQDLNVTVTLDDVRRRQVIWSARFTRPAAQAQAMQEQIAVKVAHVLQCALETNDFRGPRIDPDTLPLYLRACDLIPDDDPEDLGQGRDLFRQIVARAPRFASGWANLGLADVLAATVLPVDQAAAARREGRAAAERALRLDPRSGVAYHALFEAIPEPGHLWERQKLLSKGLSVSPDNVLLNFHEAGLLAEAGRHDEAVAYARRAVALEPLSPFLTAQLAGFLAPHGQLMEARAVIERAARIWPDNADVLVARIAIEARYGDPDRALALLDDPKSRPADMEASKVDDWRRFAQARRRHDPSQIAAYARDVLAQLAAGRMDASRAVLQLSSLGAVDAAFAAAAKSTPADVVDTEPLFRPQAAAIRRDPRFIPLAAKLGLIDFWRRSGKWPDFCERPDRPYDCRAVAAKLVP